MNTTKNRTTKKSERLNTKFSRSSLASLVDEVLKGVNDRAREVLTIRYGLKKEGPKSLSAIGKKLGITRERVRQIEADSFKKLKNFPKSNKFNALIEKTRESIEKKGGFCERLTLKKSLIENPTATERNQLVFLLNSSDDLHFKKATLTLEGFWYKEKAFKIDNIVAIHNEILDFFKKEKRVFSFDEVWNYVENTSWASFFDIPEGQERLKMIFALSKKIGKNLLNEWGLNNWSAIAERGSREKACLILRKYKEPLHFRKIADHINVHWENKKSLPQTVHNELIKDERFVLVGRGIYGLADWGLSSGTVREIIVNLLKEQQKSLQKEIIIKHVLSRKKVKEMTILVNLANQRYFNKDKEGYYLVEEKK